MISFDPTLLTAYYQAKLGLVSVGAGSTSGSSSSSSGSSTAAPTAPWRAANPTSDPDLAKAVLQGARFVDPNAAKLDVAGASSDYKNMFALYTGLQSLQSLAEQMQTTGVSSLQKTQIQKRFADGMKEVQSFLDTKPFKAMEVTEGTVGTSAKSTEGVPAESDSFTTGVLYTGPADGEVPAFQGDVKFSMTFTTVADGNTLGTPTKVDFDLSKMTTPRTMSNVVNYLNDTLAAVPGIETRFANQRTAGQPQVIKTGNTSVTLPAGADQYALTVKGSSTEQVTFSAPTQTPSVYVAQTSGTTSGTTPDAVRQLVKFDTNPAASGSTASPTGRDFADTLGSTVQAVRSTVTASDGSVYVLGDVNGTTSDGQTINGAQDVALMKYDSTGKLLYTRTLGASDSASGFALALSPDGKQLAVAGSITGELDSNDPVNTSTTNSDSFVSVYNTDGGDELWTQRRGALADDQANAVTFGSDGTVYVAGTTSSAMPGATSAGGTDGYLAAYSAHQTTVAGSDPVWVVNNPFTTQFGTSGQDKATGVTVAGSSVIVSGVEDGHAVLRRYDLQSTGAPVLGETRDLGDLQGGTVTGVTVNNDGSLVVVGSTHNAALDAGQINTAYTSGQSPFVAKLSADLAPATTDRLTYLGTGADQTASAFTVSNGQVYVTGQTAVTPAPGSTSGYDGYIDQVDPTTGAVGWTQQLTNVDKQDAPSAIAVDATGSSVLDRLGLPKGTVDYASSQNLISNTSLRAGDQFYVRRGQSGAQVSVTIAANDTLDTLATKIERASGFTANATVITTNGKKTLQITPVNSRFDLSIEAGTAGKDALASLGLPEGYVSTNAKVATTMGTNDLSSKTTPTVYALNMSSTLTLDTDTDVKHAIAQLANAVVTVRKMYSDLTAPPASTTTSTVNPTGTVPAYITAQIANYQAALDRLTGGSS